MPHGVSRIGDGKLDIAALTKQAREFPGLEGLDLAKEVTARQSYKWRETPWAWNEGYGEQSAPSFRVAVIDYGVKRNILRLLAGMGADITVVPAQCDIRRRDASTSRMAWCCRTGPAIRRRPASMPFPPSRRWSIVGHAGVRHLPWPSDAGSGAGRRTPRKWRRAITAPIIR